MSLLIALIAGLEWTKKMNNAEEPILDDAEKRYLSTVIGPVKNNVWAIRKVCSAYEDREFIAILGFFGGSNCTFLPDFEPGTMYKGMEPDRWYSLEELGL